MISIFITICIVSVIVILFIKSISPNAIRTYKNEIVSLGVLGTFIGIAIGLYYFDVNNIKESMPILLEGLKTAFITSGVGIFFSIIIALRHPPIQKKSEMIGALELVLRDFNNNLTEQFGDNFKQLNESVKNMIIWQENYKSQIVENEKSLNNILSELKEISLHKQDKNKQQVIDNLYCAGDNIRKSLDIMA